VAIRVEVVSSPGRLAELEAPWHALWALSGNDVFQHYRWIRTWADNTSDRRDTRLLILLAWNGEDLIGILPCAIRRMRGLNVLQWAAQDFSDYCDVIVDSDREWRETLAALWAELRRVGRFDLVQLRQVRPDARVRRVLAQDHNGLRIEARHERCLRIDCQWPNGEAYFRSLNKKGRNNHTRGKRILEELGGPVAFRQIEVKEELAPALNRLLELKNRWLQQTDPTSPLLDRDAGLLRAMLDGALSSGLATLFVIEAGNTLVTASINFLYETKMQAYFTAYDPAFDRASPGTILIVDYAKWAFDRGMRQVDFLRGDEIFKFRLGNAETVLDSFVGARSLLGRAALIAQDWKARLKRPAAAEISMGSEALAAADSGPDGR
jgi:CelD/BcsL family acetyltransferase involved in cellulose biosynthesis